MKKTKLLVLTVLFLGTAVGNLFAQYLDVGDDPAKIEIASTKNIVYNGKPVGGYAWSHDGEWFLGANNDGGYIMDKNGGFLQKLPRKFNYGQATLFSDNKRIFYDFWENKKHFYAIYNLKTNQETVLSIDPLKEHFIDVSPQGDILFMQIVVVARKSSYSFFSFNPENGSRQELGVISEDRIYYSNFRNFRYLDINSLLLLVSDDNGAKLKKYDFLAKKFLSITSLAISSPTFSRLHDGRHVVVATFWDTVYLYEAGGVLLGKFRAFFDRGGPDQYGINPNLIPGEDASNRALAPNGNLILLRMERSGGEGDNQSDEVYLFNFQGKSVRFPIPYSSSTKWSPQGDRMLNRDLIVYLRKKN